MGWSAVFQQVESQEFVVSLNAASSRKVFLAALLAEPAFSELTKLLRETPTGSNKVLKRIKVLADLQVDYRYEHPYDVALATYAWALTRAESRFARVAAELLINTRQTWWARDVGALILEEVPVSYADNQNDNVAVTEAVFERKQLRVVVSSGETFQSVVFSSILLGLVDFEFQGSVHEMTASAPYNYMNFLWRHQPSIWGELAETAQYSSRLPSLAETIIEWNL